VRKNELATAVIYIDTFGNAKLAGEPPDLQAALGPLRFGDRLVLHVASNGHLSSTPAPWSETFGRVSPGELMLFEDSYGRLALAQNQGSAAATLDLTEGATVTIARERRKGQRAALP
jgi:hypothetical protein